MHHDLHALDTSRTWVARMNLTNGQTKGQEPRASLKQGIGRLFIAKGHVTSACVVP